jgi:hypothetical protein
MVALGSLVIGGALVLAAWVKQRREASRPEAATNQGRSPKPAQKRDGPASSQLEQSRAAAAELRQLTEELASILDAKSQHLESLIAQADQRLTMLDKATRSTLPRRDQRPAAPAAPTGGAVSPAAPSPHAQIHELADAGVSIVEIARRTGKATGTVELILNLRRSAAAAR